MARLYLKFEKSTLKDFSLSQGGVTIGRLPDNDIQVDNLAVSGHHAKVYWETDHFVLEDTNSFNGTYINDQRITKQALEDADIILIGKHTLTFMAEPEEYLAPASTAVSKPALPSLDATAMLDTKKARELMAQAAAKAAAPSASPADTGSFTPMAMPPPVARMRLGVLSVISGKTDQRSYVLTSKLTVIGKSDMASIRLRGWFAPSVAGVINHREGKYFIAPSGNKQKVRVDGQVISGQRELQAGDMIMVGKVKMTFDYND
jgi:predicted component of type VI protein secretion system